MNLKNGEATANIWFVEHDLAIKTSGAEQCRVQYIGAIGGCDNDHVRLFIKSIHLNKELIESLLSLVITSSSRTVPLAAYRVDFIDEDDARCMFFSFFKEVPYARCAYTDKHLNKFRATHAKE